MIQIKGHSWPYSANQGVFFWMQSFKSGLLLKIAENPHFESSLSLHWMFFAVCMFHPFRDIRQLRQGVTVVLASMRKKREFIKRRNVKQMFKQNCFHIDINKNIHKIPIALVSVRSFYMSTSNNQKIRDERERSKIFWKWAQSWACLPKHSAWEAL